MMTVTLSCCKKAQMLPQLDSVQKIVSECVEYISINSSPLREGGGPIILAAHIINYTSTTIATAKKLSFTVTSDQSICFSCTHASTHTVKIPVQKMYFL
jgi:hypothetical protein